MKPKPEQEQAQSIILICDGDDNLTPEEYAQAFCLEPTQEQESSDGD